MWGVVMLSVIVLGVMALLKSTYFLALNYLTEKRCNLILNSVNIKLVLQV